MVSSHATASLYSDAQQTASAQISTQEEIFRSSTFTESSSGPTQPEPYATTLLPTASSSEYPDSPTGTAVSSEQNTATQRPRPDPSTRLNYGPTSASRVLNNLAPTELVSATDTSGLVPTPQSSISALLQQHVDATSLPPPFAETSNAAVIVFGQASASAIAYSMSGVNNRPDEIPSADIQPTSVPVGDTISGDGVGRLLSVFGQVAATQAPEPTGESNALSVLLSALPSDVVSSFASEYHDFTSIIFRPASTERPETSELGEPTSRPSSRPTTSETSMRPSTRPQMTSIPPFTSRPTMRPTTSHPTTSSTPITSASSSTTLSTITRSSSTTSSIAAATSTAAPTAAPAPQLKNASIAGIATGVAAGAVVVLMGAFFLWRRRQQGKAPFARKTSQRSGRVYPEVAWLYDPAPSPPPEGEMQDRHASERALLNPQGGATEMTPMASAPGTPELRPARPESPLLPPVMPAARGHSPGGSPSGSNRSSLGSSSGGRRSGRSSAGSVGRMVPIFEEPRL
ncbi:hypothetical protein HII31_05833 [Pseudocercospora fuligena]|uniref:Uncharacterized protein n=1 Tax=Pseudocercospora fuligena TaxID=685502 RepID=A0A8H6VIH5_9PEZI|nr:hypothetical protein HII31_05833 [Pseudocercospora fuligena]